VRLLTLLLEEGVGHGVACSVESLGVDDDGDGGLSLLQMIWSCCPLASDDDGGGELRRLVERARTGCGYPVGENRAVPFVGWWRLERVVDERARYGIMMKYSTSLVGHSLTALLSKPAEIWKEVLGSGWIVINMVRFSPECR